MSSFPAPESMFSPPGTKSERRSTDKWGETDLHFGEEWVNPVGMLHREDGPAKTTFYSASRNPEREEYFLDGEFSRIDGPAVVNYREDGSVEDEFFYVADVYVNGMPGVAAELTRLGHERATEEIERSPYAKLLDEGVPTEKIIDAIAGGVRTTAGVREVAAGAPAEWVRSYEETSIVPFYNGTGAAG